MKIADFCIAQYRRASAAIADKLFDLQLRLSPVLGEKLFLREWTQVLSENASTFTGLFASLQRVADGEAKKPEKVIKEWCARTRYKWENQRVDRLCGRLLTPPADKEDRETLKNRAALLLRAAEQAGIMKETEKAFCLDERRVNAYIEWNGEELYLGDAVEVMHPAWYQNGKIIEQGHCVLKDASE